MILTPTLKNKFGRLWQLLASKGNTFGSNGRRDTFSPHVFFCSGGVVWDWSVKNRQVFIPSFWQLRPLLWDSDWVTSICLMVSTSLSICRRLMANTERLAAPFLPRLILLAPLAQFAAPLAAASGSQPGVWMSTEFKCFKRWRPWNTIWKLTIVFEPVFWEPNVGTNQSHLRSEIMRITVNIGFYMVLHII